MNTFYISCLQPWLRFIPLIIDRASAQIEDGEIYASINQKDGMVCFHDNPEKYNNPAMLHKIDQEVRCFDLHKGLYLLDIWIPLISFKEIISLPPPPTPLFQMLKCIELDEKLKSMDQEITVNPQFVQKVRQVFKLTLTHEYKWSFVFSGSYFTSAWLCFALQNYNE